MRLMLRTSYFYIRKFTATFPKVEDCIYSNILQNFEKLVLISIIEVRENVFHKLYAPCAKHVKQKKSYEHLKMRVFFSFTSLVHVTSSKLTQLSYMIINFLITII